ncbi:MAG TPA: transcription antitermination factor NusB [Terriglobales bacterium]|nr:transcription antitermination factor NusB [Terriglobales bacterium]
MSGRGSRDPAAGAREATLQMLYARELGGQEPALIQRWYLEAHPLPARVQARAGALFDAAVVQQARIEDLIRRHAVGWRLERISVIDRSLLKLAIAELLLEPDAPAAVITQAALRLAKKYSQPEVFKFLHGLLDAIARELAPPPAPASG